MPAPDARERFLALLRAALQERTLAKLTLGKHRGTDATLKNLHVRPVALKAGDRLAFLWRHATRDVTKNLTADEARAELERLIGGDFLDAHLFTADGSAQLECSPDGSARVKVMKANAVSPAPASAAHDAAKRHLIPSDAAWLQALGVTNERGQPRESMAAKFRQIEKFAELLSHLVAEAFPENRSANGGPLRIFDMGCGKGYLTFAVASLFGGAVDVHGIELRPALVDSGNELARKVGLERSLHFAAGTIADTDVSGADVLIALHACDTATDDALAKGIAAGAKLLVVSPCCQKELRPQLKAPPVLGDALRHGIFQERQAEFVTDAMRAQLLEWAGYRTKVFEFISTEHTAKNLMIAAIKSHAPGDAQRAERLREFAAFYGIRSQQLAARLEFPLRSAAPA